MKGLVFIGLNVSDAYLTKTALPLGAVELNPIGVLWGNMAIKGIVAAAIVVGLYAWGKQSTIWLLCLGMFGICFWNLAMCFSLQVYSQAPLW